MKRRPDRAAARACRTASVRAGIALVVAIIAVAGCRSTQWTHQITQPTEYYLTGPQQSAPPDGTLPAGTKVRLISEEGSYTRIATETELAGAIEAHVSSDAIEPLD